MTPDELDRRAGLSTRIRQIGRGHREPIQLTLLPYRHSGPFPYMVGIVDAIETDVVRIDGIAVPWERISSVDRP